MTGLGNRIVLAAFDGWNDAANAATDALNLLKDQRGYERVHTVDPEYYADYQYTRPKLAFDEHGKRVLRWPETALWRPTEPEGDTEFWLLTGPEPARSWQAFANELVDVFLREDITGLVSLGAMLADAPHTRPISIFESSANEHLRDELGLERSLYEGPVGILSVLEHVAETSGVPTAGLWASVPHYIGGAATSPKATLALLDRVSALTGVEINREDLRREADVWEASIDAATADDEDLVDYIRSLEEARDTVDSPEASGDAIAQEFENFLRRGDGRGDAKK